MADLRGPQNLQAGEEDISREQEGVCSIRVDAARLERADAIAPEAEGDVRPVAGADEEKEDREGWLRQLGQLYEADGVEHLAQA